MLPNNGTAISRHLVIASEPPWPVRGGVSQKLAGLIEGWDVPTDIISTGRFAAPPNVKVHSITERLPTSRAKMAVLLRGRLPSQGRLPVNVVVNEVLRIASVTRPTVVHFDTIATAHLLKPVRAALLTINQRPKLVLSINDSYSLLRRDNPRGGRFRTSLEVAYVKFVERRYLPAADVVDVVSGVDMGWLAAVSPRANVRVVPLGAPATSGVCPTAERNQVHDLLLFSAAAGLRAFLTESVPMIRKAMPCLSIAMVGLPPDSWALESLSANGGDYLGFVEDVDAVIRSAKVVVAPSQQRSGTSNKAMRAMALRIPVAGGRCLFGIQGALPGKHFVYGATPRTLATGVMALLSDTELADRIVGSAADLANTLPSWTDVANTYLTSLSPAPEQEICI